MRRARFDDMALHAKCSTSPLHRARPDRPRTQEPGPRLRRAPTDTSGRDQLLHGARTGLPTPYPPSRPTSCTVQDSGFGPLPSPTLLAPCKAGPVSSLRIWPCLRRALTDHSGPDLLLHRARAGLLPPTLPPDLLHRARLGVRSPAMAHTACTVQGSRMAGRPRHGGIRPRADIRGGKGPGGTRWPDCVALQHDGAPPRHLRPASTGLFWWRLDPLFPTSGDAGPAAVLGGRMGTGTLPRVIARTDLEVGPPKTRPTVCSSVSFSGSATPTSGRRALAYILRTAARLTP